MNRPGDSFLFFFFLSTSFLTSMQNRNLLLGFKSQISQPYDQSNPLHEEQLLKLWNVSFPDTPLEARVSQQWKELGFQGTNPSTDFRGCGVFGLSNLLYFHQEYPHSFIILQRGQHHDEKYPFAITGMNGISSSPLPSFLYFLMVASDNDLI